jgi:hypothetical protein
MDVKTLNTLTLEWINKNVNDLTINKDLLSHFRVGDSHLERRIVLSYINNSKEFKFIYASR